MTVLAVVLAALGACGYAVGARLQHEAVHDMIGDRGFGIRSQLHLVRNPRWLLGLIALGSGVALHVSALGMAPLTVVQPIGVLALPITALLNARSGVTGSRGVLNGSAIAAMVAIIGGVAAFVVLAAGSATSTPVAPADELLAAQLVAAMVLGLGVIGVISTSKVRCIAFAAGCAVAYGFVSLLMRGVAQDIGSRGLAEGGLAMNLVPVIGIVVAILVGGWLLQHAYASGPPDLVVACLTVIDPLVAVGLAIGLLGEADQVGTLTAAGEVLCAAIACAGVFALARYHPDTQQDSRQPEVAGVGGGQTRHFD